MSQFVGKKCKNMFSLEGLIISQFTKLQTTNFMFENVYLFFQWYEAIKLIIDLMERDIRVAASINDVKILLDHVIKNIVSSGHNYLKFHYGRTILYKNESVIVAKHRQRVTWNGQLFKIELTGRSNFCRLN